YAWEKREEKKSTTQSIPSATKIARSLSAKFNKRKKIPKLSSLALPQININENPQEEFSSISSNLNINYNSQDDTQLDIFDDRNKIHKAGINHLNNHQYNDIRHHKLGRMDQFCIHCNAKFWINEKDKSGSLTFPSFAVCCTSGKVNLPPLLKPPSYLLNIYTSSDSIATSFRKNIRGYNNLFACTSFGANINKEFQKQGISNF
ncbi:11755_t:CDS:2, partial [Funneliformis geosporum]